MKQLTQQQKRKFVDESIYFGKTEAIEKSIPVNVNVSDDKTIILVVEDNADVREYIKDSLGDGFQVEEASNGEQGVKKSRAD